MSTVARAGADGAEPDRSTNEEGDEEQTQEKSRRGFGEIMSAIFLPMLPALIGAGILQGVISILVAVGWLSEGTPLHTTLSTISAAVFYFLPFLLAASTAKAFDTSPYIAIAVVAFFLHPDMVALMEGEQDLSLLGIPVVKTTYTSSVIPIILMIWGMSYVHRLAKKVVPELLQTVLVPPFTLAVACLGGLLVFGPIGAALTEAITWGITTLSDNAAWLVPTVVGMLGSLLVSVGLSFALFPIAIESMTAQGFDSVYGPGMLASNMALAGMALAVAVKAADKDYKAFSVSASGTALLGVAQPALYGNAIALRRPFIGVMAGGASGGLVAGLTGFKVYALMPAGLAAIPAYVETTGWGNLLTAGAVAVTAFVVSFAVTWLVGFEQPTAETVGDLTSGN